MKKVGIIYHPQIETAGNLAKDIERFLASRDVSVWLTSVWEVESFKAKINGTDLILTVGGDGTILRAAQLILPGKTPITGINMGKLGFMTELSIDEAKDKIGHILAGEGWIDERSLLEAEVTPPGGNKPAKFYALNDVVVSRGSVARVVYLEAMVDGAPLTTYRADGVIIATATGSTGYALAAGGPILHPHTGEIELLPIMPHLCANYCLVLSEKASINLKLQSVHSATVSIDGHTNLSINDGTIISIKKSEHTVRFLRIHPETSFYSTLDRRLKGKQ